MATRRGEDAEINLGSGDHGWQTTTTKQPKTTDSYENWALTIWFCDYKLQAPILIVGEQQQQSNFRRELRESCLIRKNVKQIVITLGESQQPSSGVR